MAQVRSLELGAANLPNSAAFTRLYECPAGKTTIIKSTLLTGFVGGPRTVDVSIFRPSTGAAPFLHRRQVIADDTTVYSEWWVVLEPGDQLDARSVGATCQVWVSGAELDGVVP